MRDDSYPRVSLAYKMFEQFLKHDGYEVNMKRNEDDTKWRCK